MSSLRARDIVRTVHGDAVLRSRSGFHVMGNLTPAPRCAGQGYWDVPIRRGHPHSGHVVCAGAAAAGARRKPICSSTLLRSSICLVPRSLTRTDWWRCCMLTRKPRTRLLGRIKASWQASASQLDPDSIHEHLVTHAAATKILAERGDLPGARGDAARLFRSDLPERLRRARRARTACSYGRGQGGKGDGVGVHADAIPDT